MALSGIEIRRPDDMHVHLREGSQLAHYARDAAASFARALVMPNTSPPIQSAVELRRYLREITEAAPGLVPLGTFKIHPKLSHDDVAALKEAGAAAGKYYPRGVTTNSEDGVAEVDAAFPVFEAMERLDLVLCIHGEMPGAFALEREERFLPELEKIVAAFPKLRIVLEHVSTKEAVEMVRSLRGGVAATITVHHLLFTLDDLLGDGLDPHLFCKPVVKRPGDRDAILQAALSGDPRYFFGSDSAPHLRAAKEARRGAAGVYSMPVCMPLLAGLFEEHSSLALLENFVSRFGAEFYRLPLNTGTLRIERSEWKVPDEYHGVVPLCAGQKLNWRIV